MRNLTTQKCTTKVKQRKVKKILSKVSENVGGGGGEVTFRMVPVCAGDTTYFANSSEVVYDK